MDEFTFKVASCIVEGGTDTQPVVTLKSDDGVVVSFPAWAVDYSVKWEQAKAIRVQVVGHPTHP